MPPPGALRISSTMLGEEGGVGAAALFFIQLVPEGERLLVECAVLCFLNAGGGGRDRSGASLTLRQVFHRFY